MFIKHIEALLQDKKNISHLEMHTFSTFTYKRLISIAIEHLSEPSSIHALLTSCDDESLLFALFECSKGGPIFQENCLFIGLSIFSRRYNIKANDILNELNIQVSLETRNRLNERLLRYF